MKERFEKGPSIKISKIGGLKCDNPNCDWYNMKIEIEDYKKYINYKCPRCGENVFSKKDYRALKIMLGFVKVVNVILPKRTPGNHQDSIIMCHLGKLRD
ncbi:hypothetical protein [uncultured Clostridium sp.]|uniref:hypothetical protein n=1 Tax=uncultured Clostridium sp. TaxID=59620 RepID=UPI0025CF6041|nr:hypothetical protein [uncultured Clostridium sp.]